jgi:hypothetical protein
VVIKVNGAIYRGILEPLIIKVVYEVSKKQRLNIENIVVSDEEEEKEEEEKEEEEEEEIPIIVPWITFCK